MTDARLRLTHLRFGELPAEIDDGILYCDPLTSLVAYPSFEQYLVRELASFVGDGIHLAIGDVDGLREYVSERRFTEPRSFGHLAGNACMRTVGRETVRWAQMELSEVELSICGTFGGDEVIVAATGLGHEEFARKIEKLAAFIKTAAPRPCSFAVATFTGLVPSTAAEAADEYRRMVSTVDARLFDEKEEARRVGDLLDGAVVDLGVVTRPGPDLPAYPASKGDPW